MSYRSQHGNAAEHDPAYVLRGWLVANVSEALQMDAATIDIHANLEQLGLDSLQAMCIAGYLQEWLGFEIPETFLEDYPSIEAACDFILSIHPDPDNLAYPRQPKHGRGGIFFTAP